MMVDSKKTVWDTLSRAASTTLGHSTPFKAEVLGSVIWGYGEEKSQIADLYELAKAKSWNVSRDLEWSKFSRNQYALKQEENPLAGFPDYEALSKKEKIEISWYRHSLEISEILHGEQGALLIASQLVSCLPTAEAKLFASSQVFDEARHVEFFSRYLQDVAEQIHPPSRELQSLIDKTIQDSRWDMKFIACQILIESLAMAKFQEIKKNARVPMLQVAIDYITKDEARHVKFGAEFLKTHLKKLTPEELEVRSEFVLDNVLKLANALNIYTRIAEALGWDQGALRFHLRKYRIQHHSLNRDRFRQLVINLSAVGLLTDKAKTRLANMNLLS